jgi:hypothetical protein
MAIPLLLVVEATLFLAERYRFWWGRWKGCAVLLGCGAVLVTLLVLFGWFAVSLVFRRRFQFRLRSLFALLTCSALPFSWLAWDMQLANRQRQGVARLNQVDPDTTRKASAGADYDFELSGGTRASSPSPPGPAVLRGFFGQDFFADVVDVSFLLGCTDADVQCVKDFRRLRSFKCDCPRITDGGLKAVECLTELEDVTLVGDLSLTDAGLRHFAGLRQLRKLMITNCPVTDAGIDELSGLTHLESLWLTDTQITDRALKRIAERFPDLRCLSVGGVVGNAHVTDAGVDCLGDLRGLERLELSGSALTDRCLKTLARLPNLRSLCLDQTKISDEGLGELSGLDKLEELDLSFTAVSDAGLARLEGLKSLKLLQANCAHVTAAGKNALCRALPGCRVDLGENNNPWSPRGIPGTDYGIP